MIARLASGAFGGWVEDGAGRRALLGPGAPASAFDAVADGLDVEDFPGRWNPRRALPREIEPLALAAARALARAGWWLPRSGARLRGGLVVSTDGGPLTSATDFARVLAGGSPRSASPTGFLFSLPSTAASVLGLLFGLPDYQATVAQGPLSGVRAVAHAADLLEMGRVERVLVASLSVAEGDPARALPGAGGRTARLAAALCLERRASPGRPGGTGEAGREGAGLEVEIEAGTAGSRAGDPAGMPGSDRGGPGDLPGCFGHLASVPVARAVAWLEEARRAADPARSTIHHRDLRLGEEGWITLKMRY